MSTPDAPHWLREPPPDDMGDVPPDHAEHTSVPAVVVEPDAEVTEPADLDIARLRSLEAAVFDATHNLSTIRQAARARLVSPWAVLGDVLAQVVAEVPPWVVLPPIVGGDASINIAVALVGDSGGGKSGATSCASDVLGIARPTARTLGASSGEGLVQAFLERRKDDEGNWTNQVRDDPHGVLRADEIGSVGSVQARNGNTLAATLRKMLTGGDASTTNADRDRDRTLPAHTYRLSVVAGVQPELSGILLDDGTAGTPQRWLWLPALDPLIPDTEPDWPEPLAWTPAHVTPDATGRYRVPVPDEVVAEVKAARRARQRGQGDPLDGHLLLTREKVATALALLHGQPVVTDMWWTIAGHLMDLSRTQRDKCLAALDRAKAAEQRARGRGDAAREWGRTAAVDETNAKYARIIWAEVARARCTKNHHAPDEGHTRVCLTSALRRHRNKGLDVDGVIAYAERSEWIKHDDDGRWRKGSSKPSEDAA